MQKVFLLLLLVAIAGCSTYSSSKFIRDSSFEAVVNNIVSPSDVVISENNINKDYKIMGKIEVVVNKTTAFHPDPTKEIVNNVLKEKAASIGANAVIDVSYVGPRISFASWGTMEAEGIAVLYINEETNNSKDNDAQFMSYDIAVEQCKDLGLENGSEKFINCVSKLIGKDK